MLSMLQILDDGRIEGHDDVGLARSECHKSPGQKHQRMFNVSWQ